MNGPLKLTPERVATICGLVSQAVPREAAARAAGISARTLYRWLAKGRKALQENGEAVPDSAVYAELAERIEQADGKAESAMVAVVRKAAEGGEWRAAIELLARRWPSRWSRKPEPSRWDEVESPEPLPPFKACTNPQEAMAEYERLTRGLPTQLGREEIVRRLAVAPVDMDALRERVDADLKRREAAMAAEDED